MDKKKNSEDTEFISGFFDAIGMEVTEKDIMEIKKGAEDFERAHAEAVKMAGVLRSGRRKMTKSQIGSVVEKEPLK